MLPLAVQREANQLVEEFMLLANMAAARLISAAFPDRALLRRHPPPREHQLRNMATQVGSQLVSPVHAGGFKWCPLGPHHCPLKPLRILWPQVLGNVH